MYRNNNKSQNPKKRQLTTGASLPLISTLRLLCVIDVNLRKIYISKCLKILKYGMTRADGWMDRNLFLLKQKILKATWKFIWWELVSCNSFHYLCAFFSFCFQIQVTTYLYWLNARGYYILPVKRQKEALGIFHQQTLKTIK